jgi:hypothetical protein
MYNKPQSACDFAGVKSQADSSRYTDKTDFFRYPSKQV